MFPIVINNGVNQMPESDIYYVVGKEGIFIKKKLGIMESLSPVKNISILESVQATAKMHIAKIPALMTAKIANFFTDVYKEHFSEAVVLLFYNEEKKHYKIIIPSQKVSSAGAEYNRSITVEGYQMIGTIHSHANFSAFHSGTDQGDEQSFDGLHITFGNNNEDPISISSSIVANGHRTIVKSEDYLDGIALAYEVDEVEQVPTSRVYRWDAVSKKMVEDTSNKYQTTTYKSYRRYDKRYNITSRNNIKAKTPKSWMDKVEKHSYSYGGRYSGGFNWWNRQYQGGTWEGGRWIPPKYDNNKKWGNNFDSSIWANAKQRQLHGTFAKDAKTPPQNVGVKVDPIQFPPHDQNDGIVTEVTPKRNIPCKECPFKEKAIEYAAEMIAEKYGTIEELILNDNSETYVCEKCNIVVTFEYDDDNEIKGEMVCPSCKTDEHLMMMDDVEDDNDVESIVYQAFDDYGDDTISKKNMIKCLSCKTEVDISMLKEESAGGACPTCGTLLLPNQDLNYKKVGNSIKCKSCSSEFTYDLVKDDKCPFCKESLVTIRGGEQLLGEDTEDIQKAAIREINDQKSPTLLIPQPKGRGINFIQRFFRRD